MHQMDTLSGDTNNNNNKRENTTHSSNSLNNDSDAKDHVKNTATTADSSSSTSRDSSSSATGAENENTKTSTAETTTGNKRARGESRSGHHAAIAAMRGDTLNVGDILSSNETSSAHEMGGETFASAFTKRVRAESVAQRKKSDTMLPSQRSSSSNNNNAVSGGGQQSLTQSLLTKQTTGGENAATSSNKETTSNNNLSPTNNKENTSNADNENAKEKLIDVDAPYVPRTKLLHTHHYTEAEIKKMSNFDSVDSWEPVTDLYLEHIEEKKKEHRYLAWLIYCLVGFAVGFWAIVVFHSIDQLSEIKMYAIARIVREQSVGAAFVAHVGWSAASALLATLTCVAYANAAGGGVPEVMAQLNGISLPEHVKAMVIFAKSVSVIFAVHSGMPVGAEGPMIQFGSIIGGLVSAGRSGSQKMNELLRPLYRTFQNPKDQRDFTTAGAAAGVTSVFASPIGGFLFVMEELASFMNPKVAWMTFSSCLCCYLFVQVGGTYLEGWKAAEIEDGADAFDMNPNAVTLFNQNISPEQFVPATILSLLPAIAVAVFLGLWAAAFIHLNLTIVSKFRWKWVNLVTWRKVVEPVTAAVVWGILCFTFAMTLPCTPIPAGFTSEQLVNGETVPDKGKSPANSPSAAVVAEKSFSSKMSSWIPPSPFSRHINKKKVGVQWRQPFLPRNDGQIYKMIFGGEKSKGEKETSDGGISYLSAVAAVSSSSSGTFFQNNNSNNNNSNTNGTSAPAPYYGGLRLHTVFCKENVKGKAPTHFQTFASLAMAGAYNTIRLALSRHTETLLDVGHVALYFFMYSFGACYCAGMFMASGIVIPTLVIGSVGGRLLAAKVTPPWSDPGVMALMGAASFFSGLSRLTVSLVVIMIEISDDLSNVAVMMICVIISKFCADALSHSLYHEQLQMRGVPFLDFDTQIHNLDKHCVADVMTPDPNCLPIVCSVQLLFKAAKSKYSGFPVVRRGIKKEDLSSTNEMLKRSTSLQLADQALNDFFASSSSQPKQNNSATASAAAAASSSSSLPSPKQKELEDLHDIKTDFTMLGSITREMVGRLLWHVYISEHNSATAEPPIPHYYDLLQIDDFYTEHVAQPVGSAQNTGGSNFWLPPETSTFRDRLIDLSPFINSSAFFVPAEMSISRAYNLFRSMTLRLLVVVDGANQVIGIIGRKNLLGHFMNESVKRKEDALERERLEQQ